MRKRATKSERLRKKRIREFEAQEAKLQEWKREGILLGQAQPHMTIRAACDVASDVAYTLSDEPKGGPGF